MNNEKSNKKQQKIKHICFICDSIKLQEKEKEKQLRIIELEFMKNNKVKLYQMLHSTFK